VIAFGFLAVIAGSLWWHRPIESTVTSRSAPSTAVSTDLAPPTPAVNALTEESLQRAADQLLALSDPERSENAYFPDYLRDQLRWMVREHRSGRLTVGFLTDDSAGLPADVLMAASQLDGTASILIAKSRFMRFLIETGGTGPPFTQQQRNDFAVALVHEVVHLRNPAADPRDAALRTAEESRVWREVNLMAVRPLRERKQPIHHRFTDADDALRICRDQLPCPPLARLVRLGP
jgi:hypothetical protein